MSWPPVSFDRETQQGSYLMRMEAGAVTIAHDHPGMEEFLILEGDLVDSDGSVFGPGDFVSYEAGTHHNSWTKTGCLLAVVEWRGDPRTSVSDTALGRPRSWVWKTVHR